MQTHTSEPALTPGLGLAMLGFGAGGAAVTAALMTVMRSSFAGYADAGSLAVAFMGSAIAAAIVWQTKFDPARPTDTALDCGVMVGLVAPAFIWIGVAARTVPSQLVTAPGVILGMGMMVVAHAAFMSLPAAALVGWMLGHVQQRR